MFLAVIFQGFKSLELLILILCSFAEIVGLSHECDVEGIKRKKKKKTIQRVWILVFLFTVKKKKKKVN